LKEEYILISILKVTNPAGLKSPQQIANVKKFTDAALGSGACG
jgi:hypothetical protein